ncbi:hypothetical protein [Pseudogulbenkiania ferrooxidans]|uniref:Uncharacterized protein n=1 Tax=Pseudogulbenkiania ferrooxidans 2002 TaxID=279714 RepID=B9YYR7_9NEIS|nr:hypothetical protein [Pseudogulbenkiania ferrooxidans]EEG10270.1 hypothetical protein FuraDRAFT_0252 [Pseudogulbenkiania ferrooxidans 2002]
MKHLDITGQTFGSVTAISLERIATDPSGDKREYWKAKCICGAVFTRRKDGITGCKSTSCTCKRAKGAEATNKVLAELVDNVARAAALEHKQVSATLHQAQRDNRAGLPATLQRLPGRIIPARHPKGSSFGGHYLPGGHSSAYAAMEGA